MAIPKIIHYCWFGGAPKPESVQRCINSWKKYCPDFEIREWTEKDFDVTQNEYTRQAYEAKMWGFVPDYIRLWIIYHFGGIYLDTDVQIVRSFNDLLANAAFAGFERGTGNYVALGLGFGAEAGNPFILEHMQQYDNLSFINPDGSYNKKPSPQYTTEILLRHGLDRDGEEIQYLDHITVYPTEFFCPKSFSTGLIERTSNTFSIHHYDASWFTDEDKAELERNWNRARVAYIRNTPFRMLRRLLGTERYLKLRGLIKNEPGTN